MHLPEGTLGYDLVSQLSLGFDVFYNVEAFCSTLLGYVFSSHIGVI